MTSSTFAGLGLAAPLVRALDAAGLTTPTPIQAKAIEPQLSGRDVLGLAETGSGKTAAFVLPILATLLKEKRRPEPKRPRALILAPTRELAVQIERTFITLGKAQRVSTCLVLGGTSRPAQIRTLARGVDVLVATPGRLTDLMAERHVDLRETNELVLDEADRMLDMGFVRPVQKIVATMPKTRRTALFSATMPREVEGLAADLLRDPVRVEVARSGHTAPKIVHSVEMVQKADKRARLAALLNAPDATRAIVFARTKRGADKVAEQLGKDGIEAASIHGNKSQNARQRALAAFSEGRARVLVATDIAARGIDVKDVSHVVQFDMPDEPEAYVHRIGRTGRNGASGIAIAFCTADEADKLRAVEKLTGAALGAPGRAPSGSRNPGRSSGGPKRAPSSAPAASARRRRRPRPQHAAA